MMEATGGRCPDHPDRGVPCVICGEPKHQIHPQLPTQADPPETLEPAAYVQIQAGNELARLVELVRFTPGQASGYLHSAYDAQQLIWRWFLKWYPEAANSAHQAAEITRLTQALDQALAEKDRAWTAATDERVVGFHRDMAARLAEDRDVQKHRAREAVARAEQAETEITKIRAGYLSLTLKMRELVTARNTRTERAEAERDQWKASATKVQDDKWHALSTSIQEREAEIQTLKAAKDEAWLKGWDACDQGVPRG